MYNIQQQENHDFEMGLYNEADHDRAEAQQGAAWGDNWKDEWILSSRDVWVRNPGYFGPVGGHPEDVQDFMDDPDFDAAFDAYNAAYAEYFKNETLWRLQLIDAETRY